MYLEMIQKGLRNRQAAWQTAQRQPHLKVSAITRCMADTPQNTINLVELAAAEVLARLVCTAAESHGQSACFMHGNGLALYCQSPCAGDVREECILAWR